MIKIYQVFELLLSIYKQNVPEYHWQAEMQFYYSLSIKNSFLRSIALLKLFIDFLLFRFSHTWCGKIMFAHSIQILKHIYLRLTTLFHTIYFNIIFVPFQQIRIVSELYTIQPVYNCIPVHTVVRYILEFHLIENTTTERKFNLHFLLS